MAKLGNTQKDIAVIGCGRWGRNHIRVLNEARRLHTVCDCRDYGQWISTVPADVACVQSINSIVTNPQIRGCVIATPAESHFNVAMELMAGGKHVLIEKPLCMESNMGKILKVEAKRQNVVAMVGHLLMYHDGFQEVRRLVEEEYLGELRYIYANRLNLGKVRTAENVWWSFAPHDISMALELVGNGVAEVWAKGWRGLGRKLYDSTVTFLKWKNEVEAHIYVSWLHPVKRHELVCLCEKGMIVLNDCEPWERKVQVFEQAEPLFSKKEDFTSAFEKLEGREPLGEELAEFLRCVDEKVKKPQKAVVPYTGLDDGIAVVEILERAQQSMEAKDD